MPPRTMFKTAPIIKTTRDAATEQLIPHGGHPSPKTKVTTDTYLTVRARRKIDISKADLLLVLTPSHASHTHPDALLYFFPLPADYDPSQDSMNLGQTVTGFVRFVAPSDGEYVLRCNYVGFPWGNSAVYLKGPWGVAIGTPGVNYPFDDAVVEYWVAGSQGDLLSTSFGCGGNAVFHSIQIYKL